ncbi:hypothetical protein EG329_003447 [Mollisiaceae sp. DMI_Dod_QoI]|nr:hypothetical protein EG329_003447 [Helotiales sp. DMI_Dod_QoI]
MLLDAKISVLDWPVELETLLDGEVETSEEDSLLELEKLLELDSLLELLLEVPGKLDDKLELGDELEDDELNDEDSEEDELEDVMETVLETELDMLLELLLERGDDNVDVGAMLLGPPINRGIRDDGPQTTQLPSLGVNFCTPPQIRFSVTNGHVWATSQPVDVALARKVVTCGVDTTVEKQAAGYVAEAIAAPGMGGS